ncbi:uridine diphosphate glucose pyrophosphatase [Hydrogenimonas sp.]|nr:uridine diphosphate glucose pyrophosphatase [Hydrogenimonas sp.]
MIENFRIEPLTDSHFIKPALARYEQDGVQKSWEIVQAHDSVAVLLYERERDIFILVRQFRPAVYMRDGSGYTYELCAGIVDKEVSLEQIAKEEIEEECGYDVPLSRIERITSFYTSVGFAGSKQTLYFAEVDEKMRVHNGGGIDMEQIEVVELPAAEARSFIYDESKPKTPGLMFAFMWFFDRTSL